MRRDIQSLKQLEESTGKKKVYVYVHHFQTFLLIPVKTAGLCSVISFKLERLMNKTLINYNTCNAFAVSEPCINKVYTKQFHFFRDRDIYKLLSYKMRLRLLNDPRRHILLQNEIHNS